LVTPEGLARIEEMIDRTELEHAAAREQNDVDEIARTERDLRYWAARRATAQVGERSSSSDQVEFGSRVTIKRDDGREQTYRIVGVDEADPSHGTLSHISPLAKALLGKAKSEIVQVGIGQAVITEIH